MSNIIEFKHKEEAAIEIERTEEFYKAAKELSEYLRSLPLLQPENDALIELIIKQVGAAEQGAFNQGFRMGAEFGEWGKQKQ